MAGVQAYIRAAAHELRSSDYVFGCPVAPVVLDTLRDPAPIVEACRRTFETWQHMLAEALDGAERVRVIVQDLLSLARSDTSTHGPTDVRKVVTTALKLASPTLDGRAEVVQELEETAPVRANASSHTGSSNRRGSMARQYALFSLYLGFVCGL